MEPERRFRAGQRMSVGVARGQGARCVRRNVRPVSGGPSLPVADPRPTLRGTPARATADRVIEGNGMYVMPGMFDLHYHVRGDPIPLEYSYYLKLAHGVTTTVTVPDGRVDRIWAEQPAA